jgi:hypothetical protein
MRSAADELFERWKELYEYLEIVAAELSIHGVTVMGDHDGTPYIWVVCPAVRAKVFAEAIHAHIASNNRYAAFEIRVNGVNTNNEPRLVFLVTKEAVAEHGIAT